MIAKQRQMAESRKWTSAALFELGLKIGVLPGILVPLITIYLDSHFSISQPSLEYVENGPNKGHVSKLCPDRTHIRLFTPYSFLYRNSGWKNGFSDSVQVSHIGPGPLPGFEYV